MPVMNAVLEKPQGFSEPLDIVLPLQTPDEPQALMLCVHPGGLPNRAYKTLAAGLPAHAVYSAELGMDLEYMQADANTPGSAALIDRLADRLRARLLQLVDELPAGAPVLLGGWSFGGVIAFQIAARWPADRPAPRLFMLDSIAPVQRFGRKNLKKRIVALWFIRFFNALRGAKLSLPGGRIEDEDGLIEALFAQAEQQNALPRGTSQAGLRKLFRTFIAGLEKNSRLTEDYAASPAPVDAVLFRARHGLLKRFYIFRAMGWRRLVNRLTVKSLPGNHYSIMVRHDSLARVTAELVRLSGQEGSCSHERDK